MRTDRAARIGLLRHNATPRTIALGNATITIINVGDMMVDLAQEIGVPESEWRPLYREGFTGSRPYPSQCAHIVLAHASVLVDADDYVQAIALEPSYLPPVHLSPPSPVEQLQSQCIRPEDITHVIITPAHFDHYDDTTVERDGQYVPLFPNARVFPGRADWDYSETRETLEHSLLEYKHFLRTSPAIGLNLLKRLLPVAAIAPALNSST